MTFKYVEGIFLSYLVTFPERTPVTFSTARFQADHTAYVQHIPLGQHCDKVNGVEVARHSQHCPVSIPKFYVSKAYFIRDCTTVRRLRDGEGRVVRAMYTT